MSTGQAEQGGGAGPPLSRGPDRQAKSELRKQLRSEARRHAQPELDAASAALRRRLGGLPIWREARTVLLYAAMPGEVDLWPLLHEALAAGKAVGLPVYHAASDSYAARRVCDVARDLRRGHVGISEPAADCAPFPLNRLDLALVPGLGFTLDGRRLGRGKGYYDRLLAQAGGCKCGIAFDWQITAGIPMEGHDVLLDCILTPTRWQPVRALGRL